MSTNTVFFYDRLVNDHNTNEEILQDLMTYPKAIKPKYFYDKKGSQLFDKITQATEYYVTRTELSILKDNAESIAHAVGDHTLLVEYGSGSSEKIRVLLEAVQPKAYMPLDISKAHLLNSAQKLADDYPWLEIHAACLDYSRQLTLPNTEYNHKVGFFPGSSLGNFEPEEATLFLKRLKQQLGDDSGLIIGIDLVKPVEILNKAYNDSQGITAEFNKNVLLHLNRLINANFNPELFSHKAFFNKEKKRVEMHLISMVDQIISINNQKIRLAKNESIHTENSYKYTTADFISLAHSAGLACTQRWVDDNEWFAIFYVE
ncbi:L-histidine N(alpha)-methyltransferase [Endozoicomonas sp. SM1973]|uniref:L-histidine N(Alpha)-methyltransferase n=1 Tax=Spartinivicinus marinus TaxID=2994442 RepID=A0A853HVX9_9GAMM|nr:L-histidine N(alpha)-methyltransferase [Spartinivicinus marinus]MCX4026735.1 L-histidine N(alpha)-methyltransferase [Spartinivicinus marinus]NYZ64569.1 L-histidine N(alpha)-methyltransferase [Spartinivicinus marinus]